MAFEDLTELVEPLVLPIRGKMYRLPAVSFEDGLRLKSLLDGAPDPDLTDADVNRILLGDVRGQLEADGVPQEWIGRVLLVALADYKSGRFSAEVMWKTGGDPKEIQALTEQVAPNRAARRKASKQSPSTVAADTTKRPASTSGTKTSRKN
jgi:hypothetical protein